MKEMNIIDSAQGIISERIKRELEKVIDNIKDDDTKACAKRKITVSLELVPDENREYIIMQASVKSVLQPSQPANTFFCLTEDGLIEATGQTPGQITFYGDEEDGSKIIPLKIAKK